MRGGGASRSRAASADADPGGGGPPGVTVGGRWTVSLGANWNVGSVIRLPGPTCRPIMTLETRSSADSPAVTARTAGSVPPALAPA